MGALRGLSGQQQPYSDFPPRGAGGLQGRRVHGNHAIRAPAVVQLFLFGGLQLIPLAIGPILSSLGSCWEECER